MKQELYLNKQVSKIIRITPRQVQHWTDKGLITPAKEASRGGTKRGYNYLNLIEFGLAKSLYDKGQGIQSIKKILWIVRDERVIEDWVDDHKAYFKKVWVTGGPFGIHNCDPDSKSRKISGHLKIMLLYGPHLLRKTGVLIYFFSGVLHGHPCILPKVKLFENEDVIRKGSHLIYSVLTQYEAALLINIGQIKDDTDKALTSV